MVLGITQYVPLLYSSLIGLLLFFGFKIYVHRKKKMIQNEVGDGICMECGFKIINKKCPNCDSENL